MKKNKGNGYKVAAYITETLHTVVNVFVPNGEDPEEYVATLCNVGKIDLNASNSDFTRHIEVAGPIPNLGGHWDKYSEWEAQQERRNA